MAASPIAASGSASTFAPIAAPASFGKATATRVLTELRSGALPIRISRRRPRRAGKSRCTAGSACPPIPRIFPRREAKGEGNERTDRPPLRHRARQERGELCAAEPDRLSGTERSGLSEPARRRPWRAAVQLARGARTLPPAGVGVVGPGRWARRYGCTDGAQYPRGLRGAFRRADGGGGAERPPPSPPTPNPSPPLSPPSAD